MGNSLEQGCTKYLSSSQDSVGKPKWIDDDEGMVYAKGFFIRTPDSGVNFEPPVVMQLNPERTEEDRNLIQAKYEEQGTLVVTAKEGKFEAGTFSLEEVMSLLSTRGSY